VRSEPRTSSEGARHLRRASCHSGASSLGVNALLRLVWESSSDAMALCDSNGILLLVNRALCALHGERREDLVGDGIGAIFPPAARAEAMAQFTALFARPPARPRPSRVTLQRADGSRAVAEATSAFVTEHGRRVALLVVLRLLPVAGQADGPRADLGPGGHAAEPPEQGS
jgi:PAS domain S-box-containing protein